MSAAKAALKAAKIAIDAHKYTNAESEAKKALESDPKSYHGNVFLGVALEKQGLLDESEGAYKAAISVKPKEFLAWQGLVTLFEKQNGERLDQYHDAVVQLAELYSDADDKIKCQLVVDKYTSDAKKYGSRTQYLRSLEIMLPGSPVFESLEGRIPHPSYLYQILAEGVEAEEKEKINWEIGQRRTRLGARIEQVTLDVQREVFNNSKLEHLYAQVIDWSSDEEVRRRYEEKLLQHAFDYLKVLPVSHKASKREEVFKMAEGLVILRHPFILAWKILLEWKDVADIGELDILVVRDFISLFPDDGLGKILKAYQSTDLSPFAKGRQEISGEVKEADDDGALSAEDVLILMNDGIQDNEKSVLGHRLVGQYYGHLDEYESATVTSNAGLKCLDSFSDISGYTMIQSRDAINNNLATALIHYQAPRHHAEARVIFENILKREPDNVTALFGIGLIFEEQENFNEAISFFEQVLGKTQDPKIKAEAAWCKSLGGAHESALDELQAALSEMSGDDGRTRSLRSQTLYRIGVCLWVLDPSRAARKDRKRSYAYFLASVQADMNFAPSYTSLGLYYADYGKDTRRAIKCFHKAFELSPLEVEAAYRLAQSFSLSGEWDLVEVVAQRVIELGNVRPPPGSKKKAIAWPFAALGVVQLNNQDYGSSIVSFQSALRIAANDYYCWVGLGESYHYSGRYVAAEKAFEHAQSLEDTSLSDSSWFTQYMLANVKREVGEYEEAVAGYSKVLEMRPTEFGVSITLLQTLVESAWRNVELGFFGRASEKAKEAIRVAELVADIRTDAFNLWKAVGDACSIFDFVQGHELELQAESLIRLLSNKCEVSDIRILSELDGMDESSLRNPKDTEVETVYPLSMRASLLAQKRTVAAAAHDIHARSAAWYNLGWTEYRSYLWTCAQGTDPNTDFLRAAIQCFKSAIEIEAKNAEFWNALGVVTSDLSPKVSQHAFVRSLYINDKNARTWTNLGALYMLQNDVEMAREAFTRAQSADPAYANAWLGQGLLASNSSHETEARELFVHAYEISDNSSILIKSGYAISMFDHAGRAKVEKSELLQSLLSLHQIKVQLPSLLIYRHLSALLAERIGNYQDSSETLESICSKLESQYEESESSLLLRKFAQAKADLARVQLAKGDFDIAVENSITALDIIADEADSGDYEFLRLSAYMTAGLAYFFQGSIDESIDMFKSALKQTNADPDIVCLLSQVLWAQKGDGEREVARDQLMDCVERHPDHVDATTLLACIAALNDDDETLEAVVPDLDALYASDSVNATGRCKIARLIASIASARTGTEAEDDDGLRLAKRMIMISPGEPHSWSTLAAISKASHAAELALLGSTKAVPPHGSLNASDLSQASSQTGKPIDSQRAIMLCPSLEGHLQS